MPRKKPSPTPSTATTETFPAARKKADIPQPNARQQPDNRWQRSKRYRWDSR